MQRAASVEYETSGDGEAVLLIHGGIVADSFVPLMRESALAGYQLVRYRRRGYGGSDAPSSPPTIEEHAADARALLDDLGIAKAHVVGHSGGGPVAVQLAIDAPEIIHSLVLLEPALQNGEMARAFDERLTPLVEMHRAGESSKAVHLWMRTTGGSEWRSEIERGIPGAGNRATTDAAGTFEGDLVALRQWDFDAVDAARIDQPTLFMVGSHNASTLDPVIAMFRSAVPHAELVVIPDADHNLQITKATPVAEAVAEFLLRHPIPAA